MNAARAAAETTDVCRGCGSGAANLFFQRSLDRSPVSMERLSDLQNSSISGCRSDRRFGLEDVMISAYFFQKAIILLS